MSIAITYNFIQFILYNFIYNVYFLLEIERYSKIVQHRKLLS